MLLQEFSNLLWLPSKLYAPPSIILNALSKTEHSAAGGRIQHEGSAGGEIVIHKKIGEVRYSLKCEDNILQFAKFSSEETFVDKVFMV